jgi:protein phosphatase
VKTISFGSASDVGMVRSENQDALGKFPAENLDLSTSKGQLFVIADGMGGHAGGREASKLAVEIIGKTYFSSRDSIPESLTKAFNNANRAIYDFSVNNPQFFGMGTTCIALVLRNGLAYFAHIGDSRLYRISRKRVEQLTNDHSKVAEMVRRGLISAEEARTHPERSMLYRAMGVQVQLEFDLVNSIELGSDEYFLQCTDGLSGYVEPEELQEIVTSHPPQGSCDMLVDLANRRGGHDNITVQIVHVKSGDSFLKTMFRAR